MISAFGVEHTIAKGVPKGMAEAAGKYKALIRDTPQLRYAHQRMVAHQQGQLARTNVPHLRTANRSKGHMARVRSRTVLA